MGKRKRTDKDDSEIIGSLLKKVKKLVRKRRKISSSSSEGEGEMLPPVHSPPQFDLASDLEPSDEIPTVDAEVQLVETEDTLNDQGLDPDILELLGADPTLDKSYGDNLHKDLAVRWKHILINGLPKDDKADIMKRYLPAENCSFMKPPKLNPELKSALGESSCKRDSYSEQKQNQMASCISAIGKALNLALSQTGNISQDIVKTLSDAGRLLCDTHYRESLSRRFIIINTISKHKRDTIKNTKMDEMLFGSDLSEYLKTSKAIARSASELKFTKPPAQVQASTSGYRRPDTLNARGAPRGPVAEQRVNPGLAARRQMPPRPPTSRDRRREPTNARSTYNRQQQRRR